MGIVSFQISEGLERRLEDLVRRVGYCDKTEAIRDAIKLLVLQHDETGLGGGF